METLKKTEPFVAWGGLIAGVGAFAYSYKEINELKVVNNNIGGYVNLLIQRFGGAQFPELDKLLLASKKMDETVKEIERNKREQEKKLKLIQNNQIKLYKVLEEMLEELGKNNKEMSKIKKGLKNINFKGGKKKRGKHESSDEDSSDEESSDDEPLKK